MNPRIHIIALGVTNMATSLRFYRDGLGFPTSVKGEAPPVAFFKTQGVILELFPKEALANDINPDIPLSGEGFGGITLAHNVQSREAV